MVTLATTDLHQTWNRLERKKRSLFISVPVLVSLALVSSSLLHYATGVSHEETNQFNIEYVDKTTNLVENKTIFQWLKFGIFQTSMS